MTKLTPNAWRASLLMAVCAALLAACAAGPDYERPKSELPASWGPAASAPAAAQPASAPVASAPVASAPVASAPASSAPAASTPALAMQPASAPTAAGAMPVKTTGEAGERWWTLFGDPVLNRLEDEARAHNPTAQGAVANVLLARAQLGITNADRYPTLAANARHYRTKYSSVGAFRYPPGFQTTRNLNHISLDASYELDLWGRYRRASEAAQAELFAAESSRDAAYLSLSAQVAQAYFALLADDEQEAVLKQALAGRQEMVSLDRRKVELGAMSGYDMHQAEADEAAIRSQLVSLVEARDKQETALAVLLGRSPRDIMNARVQRGAPVLRNVWVPEGLPSDLLLRRPDVHAAEMKLVAMNAQIGVARAQYYPSISLTGYLGQESTTMAELFTGPARIFQFGVALTQPITDLIFGRATGRVDVAEANHKAALAQYRAAVANAFGDVRNALTEQSAARQILAAQTARSRALDQAYRQAEARYKVGMSSRLDVLTVENNYLQAELNRVDAQRAQRAAVADLFKAMGGGWKAQADGHSSSAAAAAPNARQTGK